MTTGEYCNREVVIVSRNDSVREAIQLMRSRHVGDVVVVDVQGEISRPVGILTDRDIVMEVIAKDVPVDSLVAGDVMSLELVTIGEETELLEAISLMRMKGVRRLPVVNKQGALVGILTLDDVIEILAEELGSIAKLIYKEQWTEKKQRVS